jgi:hypothetical protein
MTDDREGAVSRSGPEPPEPDRYYAQHISTASGAESFSLAALQEAINEGSRQSWRLVGVVNEPTGQGVVLIWDQEGFISG